MSTDSPKCPSQTEITRAIYICNRNAQEWKDKGDPASIEEAEQWLDQGLLLGRLARYLRSEIAPTQSGHESTQDGHGDKPRRLMMTCPQCGWRAEVPSGWVPSARGETWRPMMSAPLDGTEIEILFQHFDYWTCLKLKGKEHADKEYRAAQRAHWIDHNGGGWTWHGMAGSPVGWRPIRSSDSGSDK